MNTATNPDPNPSTPATLFGGEHFTVLFRDPARPPEQVFVREVKPSELNGFLAASLSMTTLVEFACNQPAGFGDEIRGDKLLELHDRVMALNPMFGPWLERQGPILARMKQIEDSPSGAAASAAASR